MVSIIVCSTNTRMFGAFEQNIRATIDVPFEIIRIDNSENSHSICSAYNEGASKAKFDILCFAHEDIEMHTIGWGSTVLNLFEVNKDLGLLGVAGSRYKPLSPSGWWYENAKENFYVTNFIQSDKKRRKAIQMVSSPEAGVLAAVVCIDGLWFCTPKHIALKLKFDDVLFKGFHCYDIDYSLSVFQHYKVGISNKILVKHFSEGSYSRQWVDDTLNLYEKWKNELPLSTVALSPQIQRKEEEVAMDHFLQQMLNYISMKQTIRNLWKLRGTSLVGLPAFFKMYCKILKHFLYFSYRAVQRT